MQLTTTKITELSLDPSNVRKHSRRNLDAIKASLRKFGQQKPIVVDAKGIVLAGNGTLTAAQELGWTEIQIVRTELAGVSATAFAIADNRTAELAEWEEDKLNAVLKSLQDEGVDLIDVGYSPEELGQFAVAGVEAPALKDGDRAPFRQMTFTVHDEQFEEVEAAMSKAKEEGGGESAVNENSNGNALAFICGRFNRGTS
jgi:ABC-type sugar transport system ATPase subunit